MNKNRYKLIFSKAKACLVPVAENIKSAVNNGSSDRDPSSDGEEDEPRFKIAPLAQLIKVTLKMLPVIVIGTASVNAMANGKSLDGVEVGSTQTQVRNADNGRLIVDIAKPESDGISDNRFNEFNVKNGAVFNNSATGGNSHLAGHLEANKLLAGNEAKAILNQVTGTNPTLLQGGLEVFGGKADLLVVNPNGVTVNGVQTYNTDRFVVSTSDVIDPTKGLKLNVDRGEVIIGKDGINTDGLQYLDIVAKKIQQKGAIKNSQPNSEATTKISLVAGSSDYDVKTGQIQSKNKITNEVLISGDEAGAMHGKHIRFVTTDSGAGVRHNGIILSESDLDITTERGDVTLNKSTAKKNLNINKAKAVHINNDTNAQAVKLQAEFANVNGKAHLSGNHIELDATVISLNDQSKVSASTINAKAKLLAVKKDAKVLGKNVNLKSDYLENKGTVYARNADLDTTQLYNNGVILAERSLKIQTKGLDSKRKTNGYNNSGRILSNESAELIFKDGTDFDGSVHKLIEAKNDLEITSAGFNIDKKSEVKTGANLKVYSKNFTNKGLITSAKTLKVSANSIQNEGVLGAKDLVSLISQTNITNGQKATIHSDGRLYLEAENAVHNSGEILAKDKITVSAVKLVNETKLAGGVTTQKNLLKSTHTDNGSFQYDVYTAEIDVPELKNNVSVASVGRISGESDFEFIQKETTGSHNDAGIFNSGVFNIQGEVKNSGTKQIVNEANAQQFDVIYDYLKHQAKVKIAFSPRSTAFNTGLSGQSVLEKENLYSLFEELLENEYPEQLKTSIYYARSIEVFKTLKNIQSNDFQKVMTLVFGQNWDKQSYGDLKKAWQGFNAKGGHKLHFNAEGNTAKFLADKITGEADLLRNGKYAEKGKAQKNILIGKHKIALPEVEFDTVKSQIEEEMDIDLSVFMELLNNSHLFITHSDKKDPKIASQLELNEQALALLPETEEEKRQRILDEKRRKSQELEERQAKEKAQRKHQELMEQQQKARQKKLDDLYASIAKEKNSEKKRQLQHELEDFQVEEKARRKKEEAERKRIQEYENRLLEARKRLIELENKRKAENNSKGDVKIELEAVDKTRLDYLSKEGYVGAGYFLSKMLKESQKAKVIGDEFLEHQLITRMIEKKVDNHLALKYDVSQKELVKKLIDNAYYNAKSLNLQVGEALTKEQQAKLDEDIIWYVRTRVQGQDVYVPQVYLTQKTLADAKEFKGLGNALIQARELRLKTQNTQNSGTILGKKLDIEAKNKIKNKGDILGEESSRLKGLEGIETQGTVIVKGDGSTEVRKANIQSKGHLHLETKQDKNIDVIASNVKGESGYIKAKDLNLKDTYKTESSREERDILSKLSGKRIGGESKEHASVKSEGSKAEFDHLHLAIKGDLNQTGSDIKTNRITGIVQGDYNAKAGKNIEHSERKEDVLQLEINLSGSAAGHRAGLTINEKDGVTGKVSQNDGFGLNSGIGLTFSKEREKRTELTHRNSELSAKSGKLHIQGSAEIGGIDINASQTPSDTSLNDQKALEQSDQKIAKNEKNMTASNSKKVNIKKLSEAEINGLMAEKGQNFFENQKQHRAEQERKGFNIVAKKITSNKQKDVLEESSSKTVLKIGTESEAHSSFGDVANSLSRTITDTHKGLKQDGTAILQAGSDILNLITGDVVGGSSKNKVEISHSKKHSTQQSDIRSKIGGNTTLSSHSDIDLKNVESDKNSKLTLKAKGSVNLKAGETQRAETESSFTIKSSAGTSINCGVQSDGCGVGISGSFSESYEKTTSNSKTHTNTQLNAKQLRIETEKDLNLKGANVDTNKLTLNVKGKTNIESVQDKVRKDTLSAKVNLGIGGSVTTALTVKPSVSGGVTIGFEGEESKKVAQQSGIKANQITGNLNDLTLKGGYLVNKGDQSKLNVKGAVHSEEINDSYHKDGGELGISAGANSQGLSKFNVSGGRAEQEHYKATQHSTLTNVKSEKGVQGKVNQDLSQSKTIERNEKVAKTGFTFETLEIKGLVEKSPKQNETSKQDDAQEEHIYEEIKDNLMANRPLPPIPEAKVQNKEATEEPIYESIK
ncbi:p120 [Phocoenobacter uteri]|uniref:p120 n=1 Tax=Phocoenobacter uteri TaxID=146806 RepID=A0A379CB56_9PAST|nr:hemagglutinin repeat-containing protein [Phocoenobacter uteri]MDG6881365.1 hypothetical protein [Phocoenobacter uteri]SUB59389.1 p120 [Phocoenobacter uteri]